MANTIRIYKIGDRWLAKSDCSSRGRYFTVSISLKEIKLRISKEIKTINDNTSLFTNLIDNCTESDFDFEIQHYFPVMMPELEIIKSFDIQKGIAKEWILSKALDDYNKILLITLRDSFLYLNMHILSKKNQILQSVDEVNEILSSLNSEILSYSIYELINKIESIINHTFRLKDTIFKILNLNRYLSNIYNPFKTELADDIPQNKIKMELISLKWVLNRRDNEIMKFKINWNNYDELNSKKPSKKDCIHIFDIDTNERVSLSINDINNISYTLVEFISRVLVDCQNYRQNNK